MAKKSRTPDLTTEASALRIAILRLSRRLRQQRAVSDMSDAQFAVLITLGKHGAMTLSALAQHERVSAPSMNRTVNGLEERGQVTRVEDENDRRRVSIDITDSGRRVVAETHRRRDEWLKGVLTDLDDADRATLHRASEILQEVVDR